MEDTELVHVLRSLSVETGNLACLGCRYKHNCGIHGCAIIGAAIDRLEQLTAEPTNDPLTLEELRKQRPVQVDGDVMALTFELAETKAALSRVEAERDELLEYAEAQMECEMCKNDTFCHVVNPMPENCAACELKPKCPCHPCKWEWRGAQGEA